MRIAPLLVVLLAVMALPGRAAIEPHAFDTEAQTERYRHFTEVLRCPKCQNQNLAGSDAAIAADLRGELRRLVEEGHSDDEIVEFMVGRYGEFVLYRPPLDRRTLVLWAAPAVFALVGFGTLAMLLWRRRRSGATVADAPLNEAEQAHLAALLAEDDPAARSDRPS